MGSFGLQQSLSNYPKLDFVTHIFPKNPFIERCSSLNGCKGYKIPLDGLTCVKVCTTPVD